MNYKINVSCIKNNLKEIRDFISSILGKYNICENEKNLIIVAIDEVCSNLMIHSHSCDPSQKIQIFVIEKNGNLIYEIHNSKKVFDILSYKEPSLEKLIKEKAAGGFGLILVKRIMDEIEIETRNGINICRLSRQLSVPLTAAS